MGSYAETKGQVKSEIEKMKFKFPEHNEHAIEYEVQQGSENTNYQFVIYDSEVLPYTVLWGFKDEGDVDSSFVTKAVAFLQQAYGYPMSVEHTVMEEGGKTDETFYSWHSSSTEAKKVLTRLRKDGEKYELKTIGRGDHEIHRII